MADDIVPDHRMMFDDVTQDRPPDRNLVAHGAVMKHRFMGYDRAMGRDVDGFMGGIRMTDL
ncbi:hypothetical protein AruPA_06230 [Acidiphilium sp. PA]|uniref:hypothetical protein n=1 Tax=Acidiphilium sp. PA TaxID=2871705 RepID=UPI002242E9A5|nr:hypothetical protein [Acidiphilium sp. PA]MCW8306628.1 hypothetical protein [Acidiphilium sp. PA]